MASTAQQYASMLAGSGRSRSNLDTGAEAGLGTATTLSALGLTATAPIVQNNLGYAEQFNNIANATNRLGNATNLYSNVKSGLGLIDPSMGSETFANTLSPGNALNAGAQIASYLNPVTGTLQAINSLTQDEENPYGTLPVVSNVNEWVGDRAEELNQTPIAQGIRSGLTTAYDATLRPIMNSTPGQYLHATAMLPVSAVESGYNVLKEAGEWVDRTLFGNYLPGLANEEKPDTMIWNNPLTPLKQNFDQFGNITANNVYQDNSPLERITAEDMNKDWISDDLKNLMLTINATSPIVTDNLGDINVPAPGASYPDMDLGGDFEVFASQVNTDYANALAEKARGDRFVDDPNNVSETGMGYTYVPPGFVFDPEVGLIRNYDEALGGDNNDYTYLSDQDRQVMDSINAKADRLERDKMFLDPTRDQILKDSYLSEANTLRDAHNHQMKGAMYDANFRYDFRKKNPEEKVGDYFLFNGANTQYTTGREWNASSLNDFWYNDISRQVNDAINYNFNTNFNHVDPGNTSYGTGGTSTYYA